MIIQLGFTNRSGREMSEGLFAAVLGKAEAVLKEDLEGLAADSAADNNFGGVVSTAVDKGPSVQVSPAVETGRGFELSLVLVDDAQIHEINRLYRKMDRPTDVIAFSFLEGKRFPGEYLLGEIFISVERAEEQAREQGHSLEEELRVLFAHGVLHVFGYDHEEDAEKATMDKKAGEILG